ncbi:hypothetical protein Hanom_Chr12g01095651 [Helianthus anomalus]
MVKPDFDLWAGTDPIFRVVNRFGMLCLIGSRVGSGRVMSHPNRWRNHRGATLDESDCSRESTTTIKRQYLLHQLSHTNNQYNCDNPRFQVFFTHH